MTTIVIRVAESDEQVMRALVSAWARIRSEDERVPEAYFDLTPGRGSSCTSVGWEDVPVLEVNLRDGDRTLTGREVMAWLLHQAAHAITGPVRTSEGRYHTAAYRDAGQALGLDVELQERSGYAGSGWSETSLARGTLTRYAPEIRELDKTLKRWQPTEQIKASRSSRGLISAVCSCSPQRRIRVNQNTFTRGEISCSVCSQPFVKTSA